ncbi:MAG: hypothetical protein BGP22_27065 [Variovorax sp. 67-131]|nr:hypothetical protein [Variovorax sp.]ODU15132.1 MAG: hypothetical protein ABS94_19885 [Variovorax sp. SCN 67-85]ODV17516.1 MAG: hypothetical protein ABT25_29465 [Variovorax sp. SCN 67-20]OJZ10378.1 MAG: hypothetical protein BGP22_27065 [Variovorax sp. 67-131]
MLSCYGFAVLAHNMIGAGHSHAQQAQSSQTTLTSKTLVAATSLADEALSDGQTLVADADSASDDANSLDEAGSEHAELVDARNDIPLPLLLSEQPPKLGLTTTVSPFLARPKRPPRAASFVA